jgi:hypothetical protein
MSGETTGDSPDTVKTLAQGHQQGLQHAAFIHFNFYDILFYL